MRADPLKFYHKYRRTSAYSQQRSLFEQLLTCVHSSFLDIIKLFQSDALIWKFCATHQVGILKAPGQSCPSLSTYWSRIPGRRSPLCTPAPVKFLRPILPQVNAQSHLSQRTCP